MIFEIDRVNQEAQPMVGWQAVRRGISLQGLLLAMVIGCLSPTTTVRAESTGTAPHAAEAYRQLIEQALSEFKHKNWPEARVLFRRAHGLSPNARTLRGMGVVSYEMRDYVQAVRDLNAALSELRQSLNPDQRVEAETLLARARTFVAIYNVTVEPANAELQLDGAAITADNEGTVILPLGDHVLSAAALGYLPNRRPLHVEGGERGEVQLTLLPVLAESVSAPPAPAESADLTAPPQPKREATQTATAGRTGGFSYTWAALGATALLSGGAALSWVIGAKKLASLDESCRLAAATGKPCDARNTNTDGIERLEMTTNVGLGLAGACAVATGVLAILEWPRSHERRLELGIGPRAVAVRGAF